MKDRFIHFLQIIIQSKINNFIKSFAKTQSIFKMIKLINSIVQDHFIRRIRFFIDYYVLISFILEKLSSWIKVLSINERRKMFWTKKSLIYLKEKTDFICSKEEEKIYILIEEKNKVVMWIMLALFVSRWMMIKQSDKIKLILISLTYENMCFCSYFYFKFCLIRKRRNNR